MSFGGGMLGASKSTLAERELSRCHKSTFY